MSIDFKLKPFYFIIPYFSAQSLASLLLFLSIILSKRTQVFCLIYNCQGENGGLRLSAWIISKTTYSWGDLIVEAAVMTRLSLFLVFAKIFSFGIYFYLIIFISSWLYYLNCKKITIEKCCFIVLFIFKRVMKCKHWGNVRLTELHLCVNCLNVFHFASEMLTSS